MNQKYTEGSVTLVNGSEHWYDTYVSYAQKMSVNMIKASSTAVERDSFHSETIFQHENEEGFYINEMRESPDRLFWVLSENETVSVQQMDLSTGEIKDIETYDLYRLNGGTGTGTADVFTDVSAGQWYTDAVNWAAENKIVSGVGDSRFDPNSNVTREQMAVMLKNYSDCKQDELRVRDTPVDYSSFSDVSKVSPWAEESMKWAVEKCLMKGTTVGLEPQATATRAQVAQLVYNYIISR